MRQQAQPCNYVLLQELEQDNIRQQIYPDRQYRVFGQVSQILSKTFINQKIIEINQEFCNDITEQESLDLFISKTEKFDEDISNINLNDMSCLIKDKTHYMVVHLQDIIKQYPIEKGKQYEFIGNIGFLDNGMGYMIPHIIIKGDTINQNIYYQTVEILRQNDENYIQPLVNQEN